MPALSAIFTAAAITGRSPTRCIAAPIASNKGCAGVQIARGARCDHRQLAGRRHVRAAQHLRRHETLSRRGARRRQSGGEVHADRAARDMEEVGPPASSPPFPNTTASTAASLASASLMTVPARAAAARSAAIFAPRAANGSALFRSRFQTVTGDRPLGDCRPCPSPSARAR